MNRFRANLHPALFDKIESGSNNNSVEAKSEKVIDTKNEQIRNEVCNVISQYAAENYTNYRTPEKMTYEIPGGDTITWSTNSQYKSSLEFTNKKGEVELKLVNENGKRVYAVDQNGKERQVSNNDIMKFKPKQWKDVVENKKLKSAPIMGNIRNAIDGVANNEGYINKEGDITYHNMKTGEEWKGTIKLKKEQIREGKELRYLEIQRKTPNPLYYRLEVDTQYDLDSNRSRFSSSAITLTYGTPGGLDQKNIKLNVIENANWKAEVKGNEEKFNGILPGLVKWSKKGKINWKNKVTADNNNPYMEYIDNVYADKLKGAYNSNPEDGLDIV